jgi:hypothetical protein
MTKQDYQTALDVQNACNLSGVVFSFAAIMQRLCDEAFANGHGTEWKNSHPIAVLFASKIADLTRSEYSGFTAAYDACEKAAA